jgi:hypothetical protein
MVTVDPDIGSETTAMLSISGVSRSRFGAFMILVQTLESQAELVR